MQSLLLSTNVYLASIAKPIHYTFVLVRAHDNLLHKEHARVFSTPKLYIFVFFITYFCDNKLVCVNQ